MHDSPNSCEVSRWTVSPRNIWVGTLYRRLPGTSLARRNCLELVCKVRPQLTLTIEINCTCKPFRRCDVTPDDLDSEMGHRRTHEKTDYLIKNFDSKTLWDAFGIYGDIVVRNNLDARCFQGWLYAPALHTQLPPCWHPWTNCAWPPPSTYRRHLQGPPRWLGWGLSFITHTARPVLSW